MKFQQEFLLLKNIGSFKSGQVITGITIDLASGAHVIADLGASPDWFRPLRGQWIPKQGDTFYYLDENIQVKSDTLKEPIETLDPKSPTGLKLAAGNFFKEQVHALNAGHKIKDTIEENNVELAATESREKANPKGQGAPGVQGALR